MLYLGIDQHARQITISLRDEDGDVIQARQVSTRPEKINEFFQKLTRERLRDGESFAAVLEVSGFADWLIDMLYDYRCEKVILIQPEERKKQKTDRRDAAALSELLWVTGDAEHGGFEVCVDSVPSNATDCRQRTAPSARSNEIKLRVAPF